VLNGVARLSDDSANCGLGLDSGLNSVVLPQCSELLSLE